MHETQETTNATSSMQDTEAVNTRKTWKTPELRILPVPTKTQSGIGDEVIQEDALYSSS